jgi:hypothetical protein
MRVVRRAIEKAERLVSGHDVELRCGARFVIKLTPRSE